MRGGTIEAILNVSCYLITWFMCINRMFWFSLQPQLVCHVITFSETLVFYFECFYCIFLQAFSWVAVHLTSQCHHWVGLFLEFASSGYLRNCRYWAFKPFQPQRLMFSAQYTQVHIAPLLLLSSSVSNRMSVCRKQFGTSNSKALQTTS